MSKELTEKWKNGEISGCYYWKLFDGTIIGYVGEVSECFEEQVCEVLSSGCLRRGRGRCNNCGVPLTDIRPLWEIYECGLTFLLNLISYIQTVT